MNSSTQHYSGIMVATLRQFGFATFVLTITSVLTLCSEARILHQWDLAQGPNSGSYWADSIGDLDLKSTSASTIFTNDASANFHRAYQVDSSNFHATSGLPNASYTIVIWAHFRGAVSAGEVIFESGGGANGMGLFTTKDGLEWCTSSVHSGADARATVPLSTLDLGDYVQIVATFDTKANEITLTFRDHAGYERRARDSSKRPLITGSTNGLSIFGGGNNHGSNARGDTGGSGASECTLPPRPLFYSGSIARIRIHEGADAAAILASHAAMIQPSGRVNDPRPNVIVILTDDHGYADLGIQGQEPGLNDLTPHIDRLGREGVHFTDGYITAPQCVPSRAGILTGRYQQRFGIDQNGQGPLPFAEVTIPERLRDAGIRTGMIGKWHLEPNASDTRWMKARGYPDFRKVPAAVRNSFRPQSHGFDEFAEGRQQHYWKNFSRDGENGPTALGSFSNEGPGHRLDLQTDFALAFIERNQSRPFFLYLSYFAPHVPLTPVPRHHDNPDFYPEESNTRRICLGMVKAMDEGVGKILGKLDSLGLDDNTMIWFIGDNGAPLGFHEAGEVGATDAAKAWDGSLNTPLAGEKGMLAEGGIRVPFLMRWPAGIKPQTYSKPVSSLDVGATAMALAGLPEDPALDGVDLTDYLNGRKSGVPHDYLFWRFWSQSAVRHGNWKLLAPSTTSPAMLFNLTTLRGEETNLIHQHPEIASELTAKLKKWKAQLAIPGDLDEQLNVQERPWYRHHLGLHPNR